MMQITVEVSEELGRQLQQFQDRLPEVVERGLQEMLSEHFQLEGAKIVPLTAEGRVTVEILQFNALERLQERERLISAGQYSI
jgi:hypothetical protein